MDKDVDVPSVLKMLLEEVRRLSDWQTVQRSAFLLLVNRLSKTGAVDLPGLMGDMDTLVNTGFGQGFEHALEELKAGLCSFDS